MEIVAPVSLRSPSHRKALAAKMNEVGKDHRWSICRLHELIDLYVVSLGPPLLRPLDIVARSDFEDGHA
jgi:hypothetical protein